MIIGICGKSGSGKSTVARAIQNNTPNAVHCDIDKIGHQSLTIKEAKEELVSIFGPSIITDNEIDRKKLSKLVFDSKENMKQLENITWNHMKTLLDEIIEENKDNLLILDWILLPKTDYFDKCDVKILLDVPYETRLERALQRDNITKEAFDLRDKASIEYEKDDFDLVINQRESQAIILGINKIRKMVQSA